MTLVASPPASPRSPQPTLSTASSPEAHSRSGAYVALSVANSVARSTSDYDYADSTAFAVRPIIAPEAFYFPNDDEHALTLSGQDGSFSQSDGGLDLAVEEEKARMAQLLDEMTASVSYVAQRDLFHTLQRSGQEGDELSAEELSDLARVGHVELTDEELAEVMQQMDVNENGRVSLNEFRDWWTGDSEIATRLRSALENSKLGNTEYLSQADSSLHWTSDRYSSAVGPGSAVPLPKSAQFVSAQAPRSWSETITTATATETAADVSQLSTGNEQTSYGSGSPSLMESSSPEHRLVGFDSAATLAEEQPSVQLPVGQRRMSPNAEWAHGPPAPPLAAATVGLSTVAPRQVFSPRAAVSSATEARQMESARLASLGLSSFTPLALSPVASSMAGAGVSRAAQMRSDSLASDDSLGGPLFSSRAATMAPPHSPTFEQSRIEATASGRSRKLSEVLATLSSTVERERETIRQRTASSGVSARPSLAATSSDWRAKHGERMQEFAIGASARDGTLHHRSQAH